MREPVSLPDFLFLLLAGAGVDCHPLLYYPGLGGVHLRRRRGDASGVYRRGRGGRSQRPGGIPRIPPRLYAQD